MAEPWGLRVISDTTSETNPGGVVVDIVAVHGLGANPDHAWVRHKDINAGIETDVQWFTDLLPQTFRQHKPSLSARIFCFNYQSKWLGSNLSRNRLDGIATRLLDDYHNARDKDGTAQDRPLIFIGHSFGGLVIEQAVVQANSAGSKYEYLVELIGGVLLLGTPHQASKFQKWGSIVANLANLMDYGEPGLMDEVDEKSMKIFDLISEFKKIMIRTDLAKTSIICFYENLPTNYLSRVTMTGQWIQRRTSSIVVEEVSAVLPGFDAIVLDSDHLKLNKFSSAQDGNYVSVSSSLCRIAAAAPELIRNRRKDTSEPGSNLDSYFIVPRNRVKDFVGRGNLLDQIRSHFSNDEIDMPQTLILYALGGQGKSQIALEYCRKWRDTYRGIFWIDANSATTATQSFTTMAAELVGGPQLKTSDSDLLIRMVKAHLERWNEAWLLVFDNYDNPEKFPEVKQFIPTKGCGHVLFTSRNRDLGRLGTLLEIPSMTTEEGIRLLLRGYDEKDVQLRHRTVASSIVDRLGRLALAIDQAAAYIKYRRLPLDQLQDFLATYEAEREKILSYTPNKFWEYEHISAFTTWELSFQQLGSGDDQWRKNAAHFLTLSAFFAPITITESLFRHYHHFHSGEVAWLQISTENGGAQNLREDGNGNGIEDRDEIEGDIETEDEHEVEDGHETEDGHEIQEEVETEDEEDNAETSQSSNNDFRNPWDPDRFWHIIAKSEELSLLQSISQGNDKEGANFSLHPLIRDWLQLRLQRQDRVKYVQEAMRVLACCARTYGLSATLEEKTALITHMDVSLSNDKKYLNSKDRLCQNIENCVIGSWFAWTYSKHGRYRTSEDLFRLVVDTRKNELGEKHPETLLSMYRLAGILSRMGNYEEAEPMHRRVLILRETELGMEHPDTLTSLQGLAYQLGELGKYEAAESMHRRVLAINEAKLGSEHPDTLTSMEHLAVVLSFRKKFQQAESIHRRVLALREAKLGNEHPMTVNSMNNLAQVLCDLRKYEEAESMQRSLLALTEKVFGKEHPHTLISLSNLAVTLGEQSKYREAEQLLRETLTLRQVVLSKEHPHSLQSMHNLAMTLRGQTKYEEAERVFRETLRLRQKILRREHPDTLHTMYNLASTLESQNKYEEAEPLFRETLRIRQKVLGREHPETQVTLFNLAITLYHHKKAEEAEHIFQQTLILHENVFGKDDWRTMIVRKKLAGLLRSQGKFEEAELTSTAPVAELKITDAVDANNPVSPDSAIMAEPSAVGTKGHSQQYQLPKKRNAHESDEEKKSGSEKRAARRSTRLAMARQAQKS